MGKIKAFLHKESIKKSFMLYTSACILAALLLSLLLSWLCQMCQSKIFENRIINYQSDGDRTLDETDGSMLLYPEPGDTLNEIELRYYTARLSFLLSPFEETVYNILGFLSAALVPVCFMVCCWITSVLFYRKQLQKPLEILDNAAENIAENNLDFKISYDRQNEMGRLCSSFEKMRAALQDNNMEMWHQIEERRRLNTAFAHDLRTPLTVLKGQSEMLLRYAPRMPLEKISSTAQMMQRHITRLEAYVNTMNDLQRLEDIQIDKKAVPAADAIEQMRSTATSLCQGKKLVFTPCPAGREDLRLDFPMVMRVFENLLSNASRFAAETITIRVENRDDYLKLTVSDDGQGFSGKDLSNATRPFYKADSETDPGHFGMGLNICKILCEKHGGYLELKNDGGASVLAVFRQ